MVRHKDSFKTRRTPSTDPSLKVKWEKEYEELRKVYPKWRAMEVLGRRYKVRSASTVAYHIIPGVKEKRRKYPSNQWENEKQRNPERIGYKRRYQTIRYHFKEHLTKTFAESGQEVLELSYLVEHLESVTGIRFKESTILSLNKKHEKERGSALIKEVEGESGKYFLFDE